MNCFTFVSKRAFYFVSVNVTKTLFFHCILILRFSYVENSLHFSLAVFQFSVDILYR